MDIKYCIHYIFDDHDNFDCIFISNDVTVFAPEENIITLNPRQFEMYIKTLKDVCVQWDSNIIMPSQIK